MDTLGFSKDENLSNIMAASASLSVNILQVRKTENKFQKIDLFTLN